MSTDWIALTREVSESIARCELTHRERRPIDLELARSQHAAYCRCLEEAGCEVFRLCEEKEFPDAVFVEDGAVVFDEVALLTRPGAPSRRGEVPSLATALRDYRPLESIQDPGTVDGGDVLVVGRNVFVGLSSRSNPEAVEQMRGILSPFGYDVRGLSVKGCLHLKSAATRVGDETVLVQPKWIDRSAFQGFDIVEVDETEDDAANALWFEGSVLFPEEYPRTRERLEAQGLDVRTVAASELAKAEGALTCCSLIFRRERPS